MIGYTERRHPDANLHSDEDATTLALGRVLLDMYGRPDEGDVVDCQKYWLEQLLAACHGEHAVWCIGRFADGEFRTHITRHVTATDHQREHGSGASGPATFLMQDVATRACGARRTDVDNIADWIPRIRIHRLERAHLMSTAQPMMTSKLASIVAVYRSDVHGGFAACDHHMMQALSPHLTMLWDRACRRLVTTGAIVDVDEQARALFDRSGALHAGGASFTSALRKEWPYARHGQLPPALSNALDDPAWQGYVGARLRIEARNFGDLVLFSAHEKSARDVLSPREREIAQLYGQGDDVSDIARSLHISPTTVRNHVQAIFAKLDIKNKVELALLLSRRAG